MTPRGAAFHTRQTQFWKLHVPICLGPTFRPTLFFHVPTDLPLRWDQPLPPNLLWGRRVYNLGMVDASHQVPGPLNKDLDPGPKTPILWACRRHPVPILSPTQYCYSRTMVRRDHSGNTLPVRTDMSAPNQLHYCFFLEKLEFVNLLNELLSHYFIEILTYVFFDEQRVSGLACELFLKRWKFIFD